MRTTVVRVLLGVAIVGPGLAFGAVHPAVLAGLGFVATALLAVLAVERGVGSGHQIDFVDVLLLGLTAFTALQLLPLPSAVVAFVSPAAHEIRARAVAALGQPSPAFMPLTLDASLTAAELAKLLIYVAVYRGARHCARRFGPDVVFGLVVAAGGAAAAVFLAHKILLLDRVYGLYEPLHASAGAGVASAPLLNPNHLAALLGMGAAVAIGQAMSVRERGRRAAYVSAAALIGGSVFLTLSRGGMAAFVAGQLVFVALRFLARRAPRPEDSEGGAGLAWLPLGLAISLGLALFAAQDAILGELANRDASKLGVVREALPLCLRFPATGVGRGAFWVGFSLVSDWNAHTTFTHAENAVAQLLVDLGVVAGSAALIGFFAVVARRLVRPPVRAKSAAAVAALTAFGLQNLVDFNSEIPGVAVIAVALLGALTGSGGGGGRRTSRLEAIFAGELPRWAGLALAASALAASSGVAVYVSRYDLDREERGLRAAFGEGNRDAFGTAELTGVLGRHPAAWYPPFIAGAERFASRRGNPLPLLGRALELNPHAASAHFYVARTLLRAGKVDQALMEFRFAAQNDGSLAAPSAKILARAVPEFSVLSRIAVSDADRRALWPEIAAALSQEGLDGEAQKADEALIEMRPADRRSVARHARRLIRGGAYRAARALVERLADPGDAPLRAMLGAEIALAQGTPNAAVAGLEKAVAARPKDPELLRYLASARGAAGDLQGALEATGTLKRLSGDGRALASILMLEASLKLGAGRVQEALATLRHAHVVSPEDGAILRRTADVAEANGDIARALDALGELAALEPRNPEWPKRIEKLELAAELKAAAGRP